MSLGVSRGRLAGGKGGARLRAESKEDGHNCGWGVVLLLLALLPGLACGCVVRGCGVCGGAGVRAWLKGGNAENGEGSARRAAFVSRHAA